MQRLRVLFKFVFPTCLNHPESTKKATEWVEKKKKKTKEDKKKKREKQTSLYSLLPKLHSESAHRSTLS